MYNEIWKDGTTSNESCSILPWQFGFLGLKENGGNRFIKYADEIINGVGALLFFFYFWVWCVQYIQASPNDGKSSWGFRLNFTLVFWIGFAYYKNQTAVWNIFK